MKLEWEWVVDSSAWSSLVVPIVFRGVDKGGVPVAAVAGRRALSATMNFSRPLLASGLPMGRMRSGL